jgi:hypothetical protein
MPLRTRTTGATAILMVSPLIITILCVVKPVDILSKVKQSQDSKNIIKKLNFEGVPNYADEQESMDVNIQFKSMQHNIVVGE